MTEGGHKARPYQRVSLGRDRRGKTSANHRNLVSRLSRPGLAGTFWAGQRGDEAVCFPRVLPVPCRPTSAYPVGATLVVALAWTGQGRGRAQGPPLRQRL